MSDVLALARDRLDVADAATYLGKSRSWLDKERSQGKGPRFLKVGGRMFYRRCDLDQWLNACVVETADSRSAA